MDVQRVRRDTKSIGDRAELAVMAALSINGYLISIPFGENHRYDLIAERDNRLQRIQVKNGRLRRGAIVFACYSSHSHRGGPACRPYAGEVDAFGIYCPDNHGVYLVPAAALAATLRPHLRVVPATNGQSRKLRWAQDYLLAENIFGRDSARPRSTESRLEPPL